jgi:hypothetical protein
MKLTKFTKRTLSIAINGQVTELTVDFGAIRKLNEVMGNELLAHCSHVYRVAAKEETIDPIRLSTLFAALTQVAGIKFDGNYIQPEDVYGSVMGNMNLMAELLDCCLDATLIIVPIADSEDDDDVKKSPVNPARKRASRAKKSIG